MAARQPSELMVAAESLAPGQADALVEQAIPALAALLRAHRQAQEASDGGGLELGGGNGAGALVDAGMDGGGQARDREEAA